jgi:hypothetical protein
LKLSISILVLIYPSKPNGPLNSSEIEKDF